MVEKNEEKVKERVMLLIRYMRDEDLVDIATDIGLGKYVEKYKEGLEEAKRSGLSFYIPYEERRDLIFKIARNISDERLAEVFNKLKPDDRLLTGLDCFRGKYYTYCVGGEFLLHGSWNEVRRDVIEALEQTKERGYAFLKAIIELTKLAMKKGRGIEYCYVFGPSYSDILKVMRSIAGELGKRFLYPSPRDFAILKAYQIYYKSGTRRFPGHSVPLEALPAIEKALEEWKSRKYQERKIYD